MVEQPASISVIIIVRNEAIDTLNKLITEVLNQSLTPSEIIFVDTSFLEFGNYNPVPQTSSPSQLNYYYSG